MSGWLVEHLAGSAHELFLGSQSSATLLQSHNVLPQVRVLGVDAPTLVLGSSQNDGVIHPSHVDDITTVRRRSGGGAVWLDPAEQVWIDVIVPAGHHLWDSDVTNSFRWLGNTWAHTIADLGCDENSIVIHHGAMRRTSWSDVLCFAGTGPGEVFIRERKIVGISQRRSRAAALFQCGLLLHWTVDVSLFSDEAIGDRDVTEVQLAGIGLDEVLSAPVTHDEVVQAFTERIADA